MNTDTETKHTPGPWFHRSSEGGWDCVKDSSGQVICNLVLNVPENATLIAAAPELFAFAQRYLDSEATTAECDKLARAAIAKATRTP